MLVKQIYEITNTITQEVLGQSVVVNEDLSNIVDIGNAVFNANAVENYVRKLTDHIGKMIFVARVYRGKYPKVLMDSWEFGSVVEKVRMDLPEVKENESWQLTDGASYDPNIFHAPTIEVKFFNSKTTFEIDISFTEKQLKSAFSNATQMNSFISMIYTRVENKMTIAIDALIQRTINNCIAQTIYSEYPMGQYGASSGVKAINLLKLYNDSHTEQLTTANAMTSPDFLRYASYQMSLYIERLASPSTLFSVGGKENWTPRDLLHVVLLDEFTKASAMFLQSDTFHNELVELPNFESTAYWQGSGKKFAFADTSSIDVTIKDINSSTTHEVKLSGILGVMFDRDTLGVSNLDRRVTNHYNAKAEFFTNFYKFDAGFFNDLNENMVVFFIA